MKWIYDNYNHETHRMLGLNKEEIEMLKAEIVKVLPKYRKRVDKYQDVFDVGEASEKQQDKLFYLRDKLDFFELFIKQ